MVRVRFAPSPTGYLHIGNTRTALFNWIFAKRHKGKFILRIEDTDIERSSIVFLESLIRDLRWLNIDWDEGPDIGGEYGPYKQSDRLKKYQELASKLIKEDKAYCCYCSQEELSARRKESLDKKQAPRYDNRCRNLTKDEIEKFKKEERKPAVRLKVPDKIIKVNDLIRGETSFNASLLGDFIIMKSNGYPAFNFAVCVDDYLMEITHIIRGEDHLPNTPKHILVFEALGAQKIPQFAHMSMTLSAGGERLSKRTEAPSIADFREKGYLPEALFNYMVLLGWSPKDNKEILSREEVINKFELQDMIKSSCIFDINKLNWINGHYIRSSEVDRITTYSIRFLQEKKLLLGAITEKKFQWLKKIVLAVRDHLENLSQITDYVQTYIAEEVTMAKKAKEILKKRQSQKVLEILLNETAKTEDFNKESFKNIVNSIQEKTGTRGKELYLPIRAALTGQLDGPELVLILPILGKKKIINRIKKVIRPKS
jgi:nondiscriminating glutamyl-tRNA synthetase